MVQIPQYAPQVGIEAPSRALPGVASPSDGGLGQAISGLGNAIGNVSAAIVQRNQQKAAFDAKVGYDTYNEKMGQALEVAARNAPADGTGLHDQLLTTRSKIAGDFLGTITDPELRAKYKTILDTSDAEHWSNQGANEEWKLGNKYSTDQVNTMWTKRGQGIASDPASVKSYVDDMVATVDKAPNLTPAQREEIKQKIREQGPKIAVEALKDQDPEALYYATGHGTHEQRIGFLTQRLVPVVANAENATGDPNAVSPAGAIGVMQVKVPAAIDVANKLGDKAFLQLTPAQQVEFLKNPANNKLYGATYLGMMVDKYNGDVEAALVAYNAGSKNADKWIEAGRDYSALPKASETQPYVQKILAGYGTAALVSGASEPGGPTAHTDATFWSSRYQGRRAIHTEMVPEFANRLQQAVTAAEAATGKKAQINSLTRSGAEQRSAYSNYRMTGAGLAAVPRGMRRPDGTISEGSRHERGMAADIAPGPVLDWLHQHAGEYGLEFLKGAAFAKDPVHIQMALDGKTPVKNVQVADASGTGGLTANDAGPQYPAAAAADGVPGTGTAAPRSGFVSPALADLPANDFLDAQRTGASAYAKSAQAQLAQDTADKILATSGATDKAAGDSAAAYKMLDSISDADVRKDVATLIDSHFTRWTRVEADQAKQNYAKAYAGVNAAMANNDAAAAMALVTKSNLPPNEQEQLKARIAKGPVPFDDPAAEHELTAMLLKDPTAFAGVDLVKQYGNKLTDATLQAFGAKQDTINSKVEADATKADNKSKAWQASLISTGKTADPIIEQNLKAIGINASGANAKPADVQHANLVRSMTMKEIEKLQTKLGREPSLSEIQDTVDSVMKTYPRFKPVESSWMPWKSADTDVSMPEVLDAYDGAKLDVNLAADALRKAGKPVNPQTLQQALEDYQAVHK